MGVDCQDGPATTVVLGIVSRQRETFYGFIYALVMQFMFELLAEGNAKSRKFPHWWTFCSLLWRSLYLTKGLSTWSDLMYSCVDLAVTHSPIQQYCVARTKNAKLMFWDQVTKSELRDVNVIIRLSSSQPSQMKKIHD